MIFVYFGKPCYLWNTGKIKEKLAPFSPSLFLAHILPPWASIIFLAMNRPRPVPWKDFEANFVNNLGKISWFIPSPLSLIWMMTLSSLSTSLILIFSILVDIKPVSCFFSSSFKINFIELFIKFEITWEILFWSAITTRFGSIFSKCNSNLI